MTDLLGLSEQITNDVATKLNGLQIPGLPESTRDKTACALFKLAIDHCQATVHLISKGFTSSALALQRLCFEAIIRGVWVRYVITDARLNELIKADDFPQMTTLLRDIKQNVEWESGALARLKGQAWEYWCSLTHGGMEQIVRQLSETGIASNHSPEQIQEALLWVDMCQLDSALYLAIAAEEVPLVQYFSDYMSKFEETLVQRLRSIRHDRAATENV